MKTISSIYVTILLFVLPLSGLFGQNLKSISKEYLEGKYDLLEQHALDDSRLQYHFSKETLDEEYNIDYLRYTYDPSDSYSTVVHFNKKISSGNIPILYNIQARNFYYGLKTEYENINYLSDLFDFYEGYFKNPPMNRFVKSKEEIVDLFLQGTRELLDVAPVRYDSLLIELLLEEEVELNEEDYFIPRPIEVQGNFSNLRQWYHKGNAEQFFSKIVEHSFDHLSDSIPVEVDKGNTRIEFEMWNNFDVRFDLLQKFRTIGLGVSGIDLVQFVDELWTNNSYTYHHVSPTIYQAIISYRISTLFELFKSMPKDFRADNLPEYYRLGKDFNLYIQLPKLYEFHLPGNENLKISLPIIWTHFEPTISEDGTFKIETTANIEGLKTSELNNYTNSKSYFAIPSQNEERTFVLVDRNGQLHIDVQLLDAASKEFVLDTGANITMINEDDFKILQYLGRVGETKTIEVKLAHGVQTLQKTVVDKIKIGGFEIDNVEVVIGESRLLGTDILNRLGRWKIDNRTLSVFN